MQELYWTVGSIVLFTLNTYTSIETSKSNWLENQAFLKWNFAPHFPSLYTQPSCPVRNQPNSSTLDKSWNSNGKKSKSFQSSFSFLFFFPPKATPWFRIAISRASCIHAYTRSPVKAFVLIPCAGNWFADHNEWPNRVLQIIRRFLFDLVGMIPLDRNYNIQSYRFLF